MRFFKTIWRWFEDRTGTGELIGRAARHPIPPGTNWWYVFGSATLTAFLVQVATGIALATMFVPSAGQAYETLQFITKGAWLGNFLRGLHYFSASAMIVLIGAHALRVFLMGAYKYPREMSWLSGVLLLGVTVVMGFTGQLLRWDQTAVWSIFVAAEQAGRVPWIGKGLAHFIMAGDTVGGATLTRFFALHVFFIPAVIFAAIPLHLHLVLRNGISEPPVAGRPVDRSSYRAWYRDLLGRQGHPFWPDAAWRDTVFAFCVVAFVVLLAATIGPPELEKPPDPTVLHASPRPDWYLLWYFAVLALLPHRVESFVIVAAPLFVGLVLILLPFLFPDGERHVSRRPWAAGTALLIILGVGSLWLAGARSHWSPAFSAPPLDRKTVGTTNPAVLAGAQAFSTKGCLYCHRIDDRGGYRGPDLSTVGERLTRDQMITRILNGGTNMPAYSDNISPEELNQVLAFLASRRRYPPSSFSEPVTGAGK